MLSGALANAAPLKLGTFGTNREHDRRYDRDRALSLLERAGLREPQTSGGSSP
jgi:hypothetical protein